MEIAPSELPRYRCHKVVRAAKIVRVGRVEGEMSDSGLRVLVFEEPLGEMVVSAQFVTKHVPRAGQMLVIYEDDYQSISPAAAFEAGYTRL
jgi:hypothetical protein